MATDIERLAALFAGSDRGHGTHGEPTLQPGGVKWEIKLTAKTLHGAATPQMWLDHVAGVRPLGVIPIRSDGTCKWASIDIDQYDGNLLDIVAKVERAKLPLVPCRSKSGGLHLYLFLKTWTACASVIAALKRVAAALGVADSEIFPKQTKLAAGNLDLGNWILTPYFGSTYDGKLKEQVGIGPTGGDMDLVQFLSAAEKAQCDLQDIPAMRPARTVGPKTNGKTDPDLPFGNGPPCLEHLVANKLLGDGRKRTLFHMGVYYKRADPDHWQEALEAANQSFMEPPLGSEEVSGVVRSLGKKDYEYKCKESPMVDHCDSLTCRGRAFGVGQGSSIPVFSALNKLEVDPPVYFVTLEGGANLEVNAETLMAYDSFRIAAMKQINIVFSMMKSSDWTTVLQGAFTRLQTITPPTDATNAGQFSELLSSFLTDRGSAKRFEDIPTGIPWFDELGEKALGEHAGMPGYWFLPKAFGAFLEREKAPKEFVARGYFYKELRKLGTSKRDFEFKGRANTSCWFLPADRVHQAPKLALPEPPEIHA